MFLFCHPEHAEGSSSVCPPPGAHGSYPMPATVDTVENNFLAKQSPTPLVNRVINGDACTVSVGTLPNIPILNTAIFHAAVPFDNPLQLHHGQVCGQFFDLHRSFRTDLVNMHGFAAENPQDVYLI